jgi:hypothetical protein
VELRRSPPESAYHMPAFAPHFDANGLVHTDPTCPSVTLPVRQQRWRDVADRNRCISCKRRDDRVLYPTHADDGRCRICGETRPLTQEHIPPQRAFNWDTAQRHSGDDWLKAEPGADLGAGPEQQGGISTFTLCASCNSLTGARYGMEYATWAEAVHRAFQSVPPDPKATTTHKRTITTSRSETPNSIPDGSCARY